MKPQNVPRKCRSWNANQTPKEKIWHSVYSINSCVRFEWSSDLDHSFDVFSIALLFANLLFCWCSWSVRLDTVPPGGPWRQQTWMKTKTTCLKPHGIQMHWIWHAVRKISPNHWDCYTKKEGGTWALGNIHKCSGNLLWATINRASEVKWIFSQ